jgi:DNA-binding LytR/AlgR family response regulator
MIITHPIVKKKTRLIVRKRDEYVSLAIRDIAFIYRNDTIIVVYDRFENKYLCEKNLSVLESELDDAMFFRANRQYLININYVRGFKMFEKVKLQVFLKIPVEGHQIIISQKTTPLFKKWVSEE